MKIDKIKRMKPKTIIKSIVYVAFLAGLVWFVFVEGESETADISTPAVPSVPEVEDVPVETPDVLVEDAPPVVEIGDDALGEALEEANELPLVIPEKQATINNHHFLVENASFELYLKEENLSLILRDKTTGALMYSTVDAPVGGNESWTNFMQSGVVLEYLVGTNIVTYRADMYSENPDVTVTPTPDGFTATIYYPELEIGFDLAVTLTNEGITAFVDKASIIEESDRYKMASLYVYPFLGHSLLGERDGYMMIPDGAGALINLTDKDGKYSQPYTANIYGDNAGVDDPFVLSLFNYMDPFNDTENVLAPVFGMVHTDTAIGYLAIIEEGQYSARVEAYPNGAILPYNWITTKYIYRQVYNQPTSQDTGTMVVRQRDRNDFNIKVNYQFVTEEAANYLGLAKTYRNYLLEGGYLEQKDEAFKLRVDLLGAEIEQGLIFKKIVPMTTYQEAYDILADMKRKGMEDILSVYKGWNDKGLYGGMPIRKVNAEDELSDGLNLTRLLSDLEAIDVPMYLYHDGLRINLEELGTTRQKVMKKFNKRTHDEAVHGKVYQAFNYLHPSATATVMEEMLTRYHDASIDRVLISGISNTLFSYSEGNREFDRISTKNYYQPVIEAYSEQLNLLLEQPFSYLWNETEAMIDMPVRSSNYVFTDEEIPFLALTLKGSVPMYSEYVNFQANQAAYFLQLIEQGVLPSFLITEESPAHLMNTNSSHIYSSEYARYEEMMGDYYHHIKAVYSQTAGAMIDDYVRQGQVTKVSYDNGVHVYINYSESELNMDSETIAAMSYKVVND